MPSLINKPLIDFARQEFRLAWTGIYGAPHWARVWFNGLNLAKLTGANHRVVQYFASLHDLGRVGIQPDPLRLCTAATARSPEILEYAFARSIRF